jgi:Na+-translocating ferredoxin:NAD+ oxidoreductase subunit G
MKNSILKPTLIIAVIAFVASLSLSHVKQITTPSIEMQAREKEKAALALVLPGYKIGSKETKEIDGSQLIYWEASLKKGEKEVKGYAFIALKPGYSGNVKSLVGVDQSGKILGISLLQQTETPGLGARSEEVASTKTFWSFIYDFIMGNKGTEENLRPWFQEMFTGIDLTKKVSVVKKGDWTPSMRDDLLKSNEVSAITGATITTRTVTGSLEEGMKKLKKVVTIPAPEQDVAPEENDQEGAK